MTSLFKILGFRTMFELTMTGSVKDYFIAETEEDTESALVEASAASSGTTGTEPKKKSKKIKLNEGISSILKSLFSTLTPAPSSPSTASSSPKPLPTPAEQKKIKDITEKFSSYQETRIEKFGDLFLYPVLCIPKIRRVLSDARVMVVASGALFATGLSYVFFQNETNSVLQKGLRFVASHVHLNPETVKFAAFVLSLYPVLGWTVRAYGRFDNPVFEEIRNIDLTTQK